MDFFTIYIISAYVLVFVSCLAGSFARTYEANVMQSIALALMAFWSVWRIRLIWEYGWGIPHEPLLATALMCHCVGSVTKTYRYIWRKR